VAWYEALGNAVEVLTSLQKTALDRADVFAALVESVKSYSLGWIFMMSAVGIN
jgi:hypothetical protein